MTKNPAPRAWQRMLSGRRLDLLNPTPVDIEISDIAHGLARVARWNGQTIGEHALSVAQHSLIVEDIVISLCADVTQPIRLAALLHDSPEYVLGDLISPFKSAIGCDYKHFENRLLSAIHIRFGLPSLMDEQADRLIKSADAVAAYYEAKVLAGFSADEADQIFGRPLQLPNDLQDRLNALDPWPTGLAQERFVTKFAELSA